ncbi:MAG: extracellular solute-binding protein [Cellulosilyticaceae bacterium]
MRLYRKVVASMLVMGVLSSLTACASKETANSETETTQKVEIQEEIKAENDKEKVKISYWVPMNANVVPVQDNYGNIAYFKELQNRTGVEIEFLHPPAGQEGEQFKLLIASRNDLPDVVENNWLTYPGGPEKAIKDGIIIDIQDKLDNAPNYNKALESNSELLKQSRTDEGSLYGFHTINEGSTKTFRGLMVRADWLEELGIEEPETVEEWTNVLRAFKEKGVEYPLAVNSNDIYGFNLLNNAFNVGNEFYRDEAGEIQYGPVQQGYKEYLILLNQWYKEGLLHPDFASLDGKTIDAAVLNGKTGVVVGTIGGQMGKWYNAATEEGFELAGLPGPVLNKGDKGRFTANFYNEIGAQTAAITSKAKDVEAVVKMFDYLYSEEGKLLKNFGIEGEHYNMVDGKPIYTDLILDNPEGLSIAHAMCKNFQASYPAPGWAEIEDYQTQYYKLEAQKDARVAVNRFADEAAKAYLPPITATSDESKDLATIMTEIDTYKAEMIIAFITGKESLDNFDKYVETINGFGLERALEIKKSGLERYNER